LFDLKNFRKNIIVWKTRRHLVTHGHKPFTSILVWHQQGCSDKTNHLVIFFFTHCNALART